MANLCMIIQYDGTRYDGWQVQTSTQMTIQGKLQRVLSFIFGEEVEVIGSGRTDAGVHAKGQVANVHVKGNPDCEILLADLNAHLPEDIAVTKLWEVDERFHARFSAQKKIYLYRIHTGIASNVFERKYMYSYEGKALDVERMKKAAQYLIGEHDFKSFCGNKKMKKSTVREIYEIVITEKEDEIEIRYTGNGFLQNMVRILTGTLIEVGNGTKKPEDIPVILEKMNREAAGYTAPPQGLCLMEVNY